MRPVVLLLLCTVGVTHGQTQQVLFPGLTGEALRLQVVASYKPSNVRDYDDARDFMYGTVDRVTVGSQSGVRCIYTGFFVPFDGQPSSTPRTDVFNNGSGLNAEHSWPQAFGADTGNANSDLHHLFPSRVNVNSDRGNLPFVEIPDAQTDDWYVEATATTAAPPLAIRDTYSERDRNGAFEPRESVKGDIARAQFYFFTMYKDQATASHFDRQKTSLLEWLRADPVDATEFNRSAQIATIQSNRANPFVLDSTLARRIYFPETISATEPLAARPTLRLDAFPTVFSDRLTLTVATPNPVRVALRCVDVWGREVWSSVVERAADVTTVPFEARGLAAGPLFCEAQTATARTTVQVVRVR